MSSLRDVQMYGLNILKEVVKICDTNNYRYYLSWGTLLGAVRHKGFIPWDNDIDIMMPISDYKRFIKEAAKQLPDGLFLQTYTTDRGYNEMWAKVRADGTTSLPLIWKNYSIHFGIGIDIFPMIGIYKHPFVRKLQYNLFRFCRILLAKEELEAVASVELKNKKLQLIYKLPWKMRIQICKILECFVFKKISKKGDVVIISHGFDGPFPARIFKEKIQMLFEKELFAGPKEYDYILTKMYGDYMTPPPLEERGKNNFGKIIYDCEKDYREYLKSL